jgi:hypothetical protein
MTHIILGHPGNFKAGLEVHQNNLSGFIQMDAGYLNDRTAAPLITIHEHGSCRLRRTLKGEESVCATMCDMAF